MILASCSMVGGCGMLVVVSGVGVGGVLWLEFEGGVGSLSSLLGLGVGGCEAGISGREWV